MLTTDHKQYIFNIEIKYNSKKYILEILLNFFYSVLLANKMLYFLEKLVIHLAFVGLIDEWMSQGFIYLHSVIFLFLQAFTDELFAILATIDVLRKLNRFGKDLLHILLIINTKWTSSDNQLVYNQSYCPYIYRGSIELFFNHLR